MPGISCDECTALVDIAQLALTGHGSVTADTASAARCFVLERENSMVSACSAGPKCIRCIFRLLVLPVTGTNSDAGCVGNHQYQHGLVDSDLLGGDQIAPAHGVLGRAIGHVCRCGHS